MGRELDDAVILGLIKKSGGGGSYSLPTASPTTKGGVKIGAGLQMEGDVLNATGGSMSYDATDGCVIFTPTITPEP